MFPENRGQVREAVVGTDGELDQNLGISFPMKEMKILNEIVHPPVLIKNKDIESEEEGRMHVLESALLVKRKEIVIKSVIYTEENVRRIRLERSRGYTQEKITQMMASQLSVEQFRENCTDVIDNSGDFKETKRQIGAKIQL
ncbi:MAG: dephospho-CoA kinase [[Ruminococcus] torques]|uniref:dephospho-CoA kinase n=1 Tax=[Ruminococcus] torques TaxID=33039 RepID=UPI0039F9BDC6